MTNKAKLDCLNSYKKYLESEERSNTKYALLNTTRVHSAKATLCTLFCINFEAPEQIRWTDKDCIIEFWVAEKLLYPACCNGCNAKTFKWVAIKAIEKEIQNLLSVED